MAPKISPLIASLVKNKTAAATILKLVNQRVELDAREHIVTSIFDRVDTLAAILADEEAGKHALILKILQQACVDEEERAQLAHQVRACLLQTGFEPHYAHQQSRGGYTRLLEELSSILPNDQDLPTPRAEENNPFISFVGN